MSYELARHVHVGDRQTSAAVLEWLRRRKWTPNSMTTADHVPTDRPTLIEKTVAVAKNADFKAAALDIASSAALAAASRSRSAKIVNSTI
jgi:hypothetical protein